MLYLYLAEIVQRMRPATDLSEDFRLRARYENMPGIPGIHYPLRDIDAPTCNITVCVNISDSINRTSMNAHSQP
jgi:hypothetical protein